MQIEIITLFPESFCALKIGITGRAIDDKIINLNFWNPRDYTKDRHRTVDDKPYGGGPGMLMKVEPLCDAIHAAKKATNNKAKAIYLSPQGRRLDQKGVIALSKCESLILVSGRYEGIDERVIQSEIDEEYSIGDYVLSGGELAAMVVIDCITRLLPGALGNEESAGQDSFMEGLLDYPHYTRPEEFNGLRVPKVLLGGNHKEIAKWRLKQSLGITWLKRPDLLEHKTLSEEEVVLLEEFKQSYYK